MSQSPLDMMNEPMLGGLLDNMLGTGGLPGFTGGNAGPAISSVQGNPYFYAPFNVAGSGGQATSVPSQSGGGDYTMLIMIALGAAALFFVGGKK